MISGPRLMLLVALLGLAGRVDAQDAQGRKRPAPRQFSLYQTPPRGQGVVVEHWLDEKGYQVRFGLRAILVSDRPEATRRPWELYRFTTPEAGKYGKLAVKAGLVHEVIARPTSEGFEVDVKHRAYRPPRPDKVEIARVGSDRLVKLSNEIITGCFPKDRSAALARAFRSQLRSSRARFARGVLHAFCLAYEDKPKALTKQPKAVWIYLARLLKVEQKGDLTKQVYPAIRMAICGVEVWQTFRPASDVAPARANPVHLRGVVGRAVLVGSVGGAGKVDWWRLTMSDPLDPIAAKSLPEGVTWVRVRQKGFRGCYLRVHGAQATPASYRIEARNKSGKEYQWIEVHERPPAGKKLPY